MVVYAYNVNTPETEAGESGVKACPLKPVSKYQKELAWQHSASAHGDLLGQEYEQTRIQTQLWAVR